MIDPDVRNAIYQLHLAGTPLKQIGRQLHVGLNTVRRVVRGHGVVFPKLRKDKIPIDPELLRRLYRECGGRLQRVHEKLVEDEKVQVSYPTLTRRVRELGLGQPANIRCDHVPDEPGLEMQHDTTLYRVELAGKPTRVVASLLYLRYSKRRYLKFYRVFNRFAMKCFLHEGLLFWGCAARQCVIDNTNLARLRGSGHSAVIVPEMAAFAERYGFQFLCHAIRHPNRKAGEERSFWTVETNFLPGRSFQSLEDLNEQARQWATVRMEHRPQGKAALIPAKAFEHERGFLTVLSGEIPAPYCSLERGTDPYGYVAVEGNYYWVPGERREDVKVLRYAERLKIYRQGACLAEYPLPPDGVKNAHFSPQGQPSPRHLPKHRKDGSQHEEQRLRALGAEVAPYLDYALQTAGIQRHRFLRELFALSRQVTRGVFVEALTRALRYRVTEMESLRRIAWFCMSQGQQPQPYVDMDVDEGFRQRPAYQDGCLTDQPDLSIYDDDEDPREDANEEKDDPTGTESEDEHG